MKNADVCKLARVLLVILLDINFLFSQGSNPTDVGGTFKVEGTVASPWDAMFKDVAVPANKVIFPDQRASEALQPGKGEYISVPRAKVVFRGKLTKTVTVDDEGHYQLDLPIGSYEMTAYGPTVNSQKLTKYFRRFRVTSPSTLILNATLYLDRMNCDAVVNERDPEEWKNACGGEDSFDVLSQNNAALKVFIQYGHRQANKSGYVYLNDKIGRPGVPVVVTYDLFSLAADSVIYDINSMTLIANGNVVSDRGTGRVEHFNTASFKIEDSQVIQLN